jgi:hypothetical protein
MESLLDPLNDGPCRCFRPRSLHGTQPALDVTVIGFDTVITIAPRPLAAPSFHATISLELTNGCGVTAQSVARESLRRLVVGVRQCPFQEQLDGLAVPCLGEVEVHRLAAATAKPSEYRSASALASQLAGGTAGKIPRRPPAIAKTNWYMLITRVTLYRQRLLDQLLKSQSLQHGRHR